MHLCTICMASTLVQQKDTPISLPADFFTPSGCDWMKQPGASSQIATQGQGLQYLWYAVVEIWCSRAWLEARTAAPARSGDTPAALCKEQEDALLHRCTNPLLKETCLGLSQFKFQIPMAIQESGAISA